MESKMNRFFSVLVAIILTHNVLCSADLQKWIIIDPNLLKESKADVENTMIPKITKALRQAPKVSSIIVKHPGMIKKIPHAIREGKEASKDERGLFNILSRVNRQVDLGLSQEELITFTTIIAKFFPGINEQTKEALQSLKDAKINLIFASNRDIIEHIARLNVAKDKSNIDLQEMFDKIIIINTLFISQEKLNNIRQSHPVTIAQNVNPSPEYINLLESFTDSQAKAHYIKSAKGKESIDKLRYLLPARIILHEVGSNKEFVEKIEELRTSSIDKWKPSMEDLD